MTIQLKEHQLFGLFTAKVSFERNFEMEKSSVDWDDSRLHLMFWSRSGPTSL